MSLHLLRLRESLYSNLPALTTGSVYDPTSLAISPGGSVYLDVRGKKPIVEEVEAENAEDGMSCFDSEKGSLADLMRYHHRQEEQVKEGFYYCFISGTHRCDTNKSVCRLDYRSVEPLFCFRPPPSQIFLYSFYPLLQSIRRFSLVSSSPCSKDER